MKCRPPRPKTGPCLMSMVGMAVWPSGLIRCFASEQGIEHENHVFGGILPASCRSSGFAGSYCGWTKSICITQKALEWIDSLVNSFKNNCFNHGCLNGGAKRILQPSTVALHPHPPLSRTVGLVVVPIARPSLIRLSPP